jgi:hypothetical protein
MAAIAPRLAGTACAAGDTGGSAAAISGADL